GGGPLCRRRNGPRQARASPERVAPGRALHAPSQQGRQPFGPRRDGASSRRVPADEKGPDSALAGAAADLRRSLERGTTGGGGDQAGSVMLRRRPLPGAE